MLVELGPFVNKKYVINKDVYLNFQKIQIICIIIER